MPPQTNITRAFDFSAREAELFDVPTSTYAIRNREFADAFVALNRERVWNPDAPTAKRNARWRRLIYAGTVGILVALALWDMVSGWFGR